MFEEGYKEGFYYMPGYTVQEFVDDAEAWEYEKERD